MQFQTGTAQHKAAINQVIVAGWTGRNAKAVAHHIEELAAIGIAPPSTVPLFYRVSNSILVQEGEIEVLGNDTSGEVEPFLLHSGGAFWLGLASDHTDRALEAVSVAASKQACPKPVAPELWRFDEVADHLDDIILRSFIHEAGDWVLYQEGTMAGILPLMELAQKADLKDGSAMLCGTLPAIGPIRPADIYRMEMEDKQLGRVLRLSYSVKTLPIVA